MSTQVARKSTVYTLERGIEVEVVEEPGRSARYVIRRRFDVEQICLCESDAKLLADFLILKFLKSKVMDEEAEDAD